MGNFRRNTTTQKDGEQQIRGREMKGHNIKVDEGPILQCTTCLPWMSICGDFHLCSYDFCSCATSVCKCVGGTRASVALISSKFRMMEAGISFHFLCVRLSDSVAWHSMERKTQHFAARALETLSGQWRVQLSQDRLLTALLPFFCTYSYSLSSPLRRAAKHCAQGKFLDTEGSKSVCELSFL